MLRFVKMVSPAYDIYKRSGYPAGHPIANQDAANRIVTDMINDGLFVDFVERLIQIDSKGFMGRKYQLRGLDDMINGVIENGYTYDKMSGQFMENQQERISLNWGRLRNGDEKQLTVLRLDVVGNSALVKEHPRANVEKAFRDLREITAKAVVSRYGRLWSWEGDGALAAFMFGDKDRMAVFSGMEILHELFLYNRLRNPLTSPIKVRIGVHAGPVRYFSNINDSMKGETIRQALHLESITAPNTLAISRNLFMAFGHTMLSILSEEKNSGAFPYRQYSAGVA
jgi:class 3 adenylate cyclase